MDEGSLGAHGQVDLDGGGDRAFGASLHVTRGASVSTLLPVRAFGILCASIALAVSIGVVLVRSPASEVPTALYRAIANTLAFRSAEIFQILPQRPAVVGPAIYQAPDRWAGTLSPSNSGSEHSISLRTVVIGDSEYEEPIARVAGQGLGVLRMLHHPVATLHESAGLTPAQQLAFLPLVDVNHGHAFDRIGGTWAFESGVNERGVTVIGGEVWLSDACGTGPKPCVSQASLTEEMSGRMITATWIFNDIDRAPRVQNPSGVGV
jgi:hypothetical protein